MFRQITFFKVFRVPKQRTGIFEVSNTWTILCNNMVEEKAGIKKQNSKKGFEKNEHACSWSFVGFGFHCQSIFEGGQPDYENSNLVKAQTVPKVTSRNSRHAAGSHWHRYIKARVSALTGSVPRKVAERQQRISAPCWN